MDDKIRPLHTLPIPESLRALLDLHDHMETELKRISGIDHSALGQQTKAHRYAYGAAMAEYGKLLAAVHASAQLAAGMLDRPMFIDEEPEAVALPPHERPANESLT